MEEFERRIPRVYQEKTPPAGSESPESGWHSLSEFEWNKLSMMLVALMPHIVQMKTPTLVEPKEIPGYSTEAREDDGKTFIRLIPREKGAPEFMVNWPKVPNDFGLDPVKQAQEWSRNTTVIPAPKPAESHQKSPMQERIEPSDPLKGEEKSRES